MLADLLLFLGVPGMLLVSLAYVIGSIGVILLLLKRRWRLSVTLALSLFLTAVGLIYLMVASREREHSAYLTGLFATQVELPPPLFRHDPPRIWQGDGFSLVVYELPDLVRRRFLNADQQLLTAHPSPGEERPGSDVCTWRTGGVDEKSEKILHFALSATEVQDDSELMRQGKTIWERINASGTYYAYILDRHGDQIANLDLFVVDLEAGRLYFLNLNT